MSKAVRIRQGLIVRLIRRISEANRTGLRSYFGATDINQSRDVWTDNPMVAPPELALLPIPDICPLPALDMPLMDQMAVDSKKLNQNTLDIVSVSQLRNTVNDEPPKITKDQSLPNEALKIDELVQALEITGAKVKEIRSFSTGGNCIKVEDFFTDNTNREFEYAKVRRK